MNQFILQAENKAVSLCAVEALEVRGSIVPIRS
jgi:hypothetical protein